MRIPKVFLPEKNLNYKIEELSKDKIKTKQPFEDSYLYSVLYCNLRCCLHTLKEGPVKIFWISDKHQESKYEGLEDMIAYIIKESDVKLAYGVYDYYGKNFGRTDMLKMLEDSLILDKSHIVYIDHKTTEILKEDKENLSFFDSAFVIIV